MWAKVKVEGTRVGDDIMTGGAVAKRALMRGFLSKVPWLRTLEINALLPDGFATLIPGLLRACAGGAVDALSLTGPGLSKHEWCLALKVRALGFAHNTTQLA